MSERYPGWLRGVLIAQLAIALLFWLMAWDHTVSLAQGRPARTADVAAMAMPLVAVVVLGGASIRLWRGGRGDWATAAALSPLLLALVLFRLLGAV